MSICPREGTGARRTGTVQVFISKVFLGGHNITVVWGSVGHISVTLEIHAPLLQKLPAPSGCFAEGGLDIWGDCLQLRHNSTSRNF